jgi:hypothetical protein
MKIMIRLLAAAVLLFTLAPGAHAQVWNESPDAGDLVPTAQSTAGTGPLTQINGFLAAPTDADLYCVVLPTVPPQNLPLLQLQCVTDAGPNIYLFDAAGNGVFTNERCQFGSKTILAPGTGLSAGIYYVAVSFTGYAPESAGGPIWQTGLPGQRVPDGPGAAGSLVGWAGASPLVQPLNPYTINLTGFTFCQAPTPVGGQSWGNLKAIYR